MHTSHSKPVQMPPEARRNRIRTLIASNSSAAIRDLATQFTVSEMTIRRDLDQLESTGLLQRTHGGAITTQRLALEFTFGERQQQQRAAKQAIAREAVKLVRPGQRILIDNGTTTLELAALLSGLKDITVITPSLAVLSLLQFNPGIELILLGGMLRPGSPELTGALTEHCLDMLTADIAFQGADGIGLDGSVYNSDMRLARVDQKMRECSDRTFILCDSSKITHKALARNGSLRRVEALITDNRLSLAHRRTLQKAGVRVVQAPVSESKGK
jgi:DeoR/GlpR family transcriptional regulator of sugar metabolism